MRGQVTVGLGAAVVTTLLACRPALGQSEGVVPLVAAAGPGAMLENQWARLGECPPDPLGREFQPGRGAYWIFEPAGGKFLRYGGYTPTDDNGLWSYDLASRRWANPIRTDYSWPPPADRPGAGAWWSMAYDAGRKVIWLHGGSGVASRTHPELFEDIWQYDPAKGTFKPSKCKNYPRYGAPIVYDARNDLIVRAPAYDGEWAALHNRDKTWVYDPNKNAWQGRPTKPMPTSRGQGGFVYEPNLGKCVYLGYERPGGPIAAWTYDAAANTWTALDAGKPAPPSRVCPAACYDPHNKVVLVYGGVGGPEKGYGYLYRGGGINLDDTWALDVAKGRWTKLSVGAPVRPKLPGERGTRFVLPMAMDYNTKLGAAVVSAPTFGVWALRYRAENAPPLPELRLVALTPFGDSPHFGSGSPKWGLSPSSSETRGTVPFFETTEKGDSPSQGPVYQQAPPNRKLLDLPAMTWTKLGGGPCLGGGEVPWSYDEATGFVLKFGGCNNAGTTFASGYGNDLSAYDPATERWIALRWVDPCGPPRPANGCTRYYAYDPVRKVTWFAAGTAGNQLAASTLTGFDARPGVWFYDGLRDRFEIAPTGGSAKFGTGVVSAYDRANNLWVIDPKEAWAGPNVCTFDPEKRTWADTGVAGRATVYTYGCYVEGLKGMMVIEPVKDQPPRTLLFDASAKAWRDLAPGGDALPTTGRPALACDPGNDVVLFAASGKTLAYSVKDNQWKALDVQTPPVAEMLVFDRRHKVFLATAAMGKDVYAFRYKPGDSPHPGIR